MSWSTVGTIVGSYFGYPGLGAAIGGAIDAANAPGASKLDDLKAARVSLGSPINHIFGHPRHGGNVAWVSDAIEAGEVGGASKGGGGGGGQMTYVRHCLVIMGEDETGPPVRMWAAGKLIYSVSADADDETVETSVEDGIIGEVIYYNGADDQMPDPTYEEFVGEGFVSANRGRPTMMLKSIQCGTSGQLPIITFEVGGKGTQVDLSTKLILTEFARSDILHQPPTGAFTGGGTVQVCAVRNGKVVTSSSTGGVTTATSYDTITGSLINEPGSGGGDKALMVFGRAGNLAGFSVSGAGYSYNVDLPDPGHYLGSSEIRFSTRKNRIAVGTSAAIGAGEDNPEGATGNLGNVYLYQHEATSPDLIIPIGESHQWLALFDDMLYVQTVSGVYPVDINALSVGGPFAMMGDQIFAGQDGHLYSADDDGTIRKWDGGSWIDYAVLELTGVDFSPSNCTYMVSTAGNVYAVEMYTKIVNEVYRFWFDTNESPNVPENQFPSLMSCVYQPEPKDELWIRRNQYYTSGGLRARRNPVMGEPVILEIPVGPYFKRAELQQSIELFWEEGEIPEQPEGHWQFTTVPLVFYETSIGTIDYPQYWHNVYRLRRTPVYDLSEPTLQEVVESLCYRAGLSEDQVNAEELATKYVHALAVTQVGPTSSTLQLLADTYKFWCRESQGQLVFRFYGDESARTLTSDELGASMGDPQANPLPITRGSELELPSMQSVTYANIDNDYQDGLESSDRLLQSVQSASSIQLALGLTPTEAKQIAVINQQVILSGLLRVGPLSVGPANRAIEPGDIVTATRQNGDTLQVCCEKVTYDRGLVTIEGKSYDSVSYTSDASTATNYTSAVNVRPPAQTEALVLDPPLLSDEQDGPSLQVIARPERFPWPGYSEQRSPDGTTYTEIYRSATVGVFGTCLTAMPAWTGANTIDNTSTVRVNVGTGSLASITRNELLTSRLNLFLAGGEMFQAQRVELFATGVYDLSGLIRYLGGTEAATHEIGEVFAVLDPAKMNRVSLNLADQGISRFHRHVTIGRNPDSAPVDEVTPDMVSMKPIAPSNVHALVRANGDILLRWNRRTRYQSNSLRGIVPLDYSSEAYTVDIYDGEDFLRQITSTTTTATYTTAQQATDGIGSGFDLRFVLRQVGAVQGHAAEALMEI